MMLPQTVQDCLLKRKYFIAVGSDATHFFMDIRDKYDPHNGHKHICTLITYDRRTDLPAMNGSNDVDGRLVEYVRKTASCIGKTEDTAQALFKAFSELAAESGRF